MAELKIPASVHDDKWTVQQLIQHLGGLPKHAYVSVHGQDVTSNAQIGTCSPRAFQKRVREQQVHLAVSMWETALEYTSREASSHSVATCLP